MFHDQKTGGIMGLQPLAINMPLRITLTDQNEKTTLFKNRRCKLYGWKLHAVDLARLDACVEREMALEYLPEELLLKFEGVSWEWSKDLGPGIMAVNPKAVDWYLDRAYLLLPAQAGVLDHFKTYVKYPPRYKAASFTIDQDRIIEQLTPEGG